MLSVFFLCFPHFFLSFSFKMSLNVHAPAWSPATAANETIANLVKLANCPSVWARNGWGAYKKAPFKPCTTLSNEEALVAVRQHPGILEMLPEHQRTYPVVLAAMQSAPKEAIQNYNCNGENFPLLHAPLEHRDETVCLAAASWCNRALWFWPPSMRNKDMYLKAIKANPKCIDTMPGPFCNDPEILAFAPKRPTFNFDI